MSNVVNKLIFNCLVQYGNVALPSVGALQVEGNPKKVVFTETISENHIPVTEIIAEQGKISAEEAQALYNDWLQGATDENGSIHAEGVGTITPRRFDIDKELHLALNGDNIPVATLRKRRRYGWIWWIVALVAIVGIALCLCPCNESNEGCNYAAICTERGNNGICANCGQKPECADCEINKECENKPVCPANADKCDGNGECAAATTDVTLQPSVEPRQEVTTEITVTPAKPAVAAKSATTDGLKRYNVAVGVFTIKYNARACARQDALGIGAENYIIAPYPGGYWIVVACATDSAAEAERMRKLYRIVQPDVWVYKR